MIDEWPSDLVDLLANPGSTEPVAIWIGAGLGQELGYPLTTPLVELLIQVCKDAHCDAADIQIARDYLGRGEYRLAADQCQDVLNDPPRFRQVLLDAFSATKERDSGLLACENVLAAPFNAYVTTNYNTSLSTVSGRLGRGEPMYKLAPDMVYPYLDPARLPKRCIHYIHSNVTQIDDIVLGERDFLKAYRDGSCLPKFLEVLFATHHVLFFGTEVRDDDTRWILHKMQRVFQATTTRKRYILLATTEQGAARVHTLERTYQVRPIWYTVEHKTIQTQHEPTKHIVDRSKLYQLLSELRGKTQAGWIREELKAADR